LQANYPEHKIRRTLSKSTTTATLFGMNSQMICQLCNFSPETPRNVCRRMVSLAKHARERIHLETFCVFPDTARHWLNVFDSHSVPYGFVPRKRSVTWSLKSLLDGRESLLFHTHSSMCDLPAALLKTAVFKTSRIVWHYHNPTLSTLGQRGRDTVKFQIIGRTATASCIAVGDGVYRSLVDAGFEGRRLFLVRNGVDTNRFLRDDGRRDKMRRQLGQQAIVTHTAGGRVGPLARMGELVRLKAQCQFGLNRPVTDTLAAYESAGCNPF